MCAGQNAEINRKEPRRRTSADPLNPNFSIYGETERVSNCRNSVPGLGWERISEACRSPHLRDIAKASRNYRYK